MTTHACEDVILSLTDDAAAEVKSRLATQGNGIGLRLAVEEGGCSGFQYSLGFEEKQPSDVEYVHKGVPIFVDSSSVEYVRGSILEFSSELLRGGFMIQNPNVHSCGCGSSFHS